MGIIVDKALPHETHTIFALIRRDKMMTVPRHGPALNHILPFALFGFLAPIATYLVAVSNLSTDAKTAVLSVLAGLYVLLFVASIRRFRSLENGTPASSLIPPNSHVEGAQHSNHEAITGFANEQGFQMVLEREVAESLRNPDERPLSVLSIGIAEMSSIEKAYGPDFHERILIYAAEKIRNNLRAMDFAACVDGDEFLVVLPTADQTGATEISNRIARSFSEEPFRAGEDELLKLRISVGIAGFEIEGDTAESLVRTARARKQDVNAGMPRDVADRSGEYFH